MHLTFKLKGSIPENLNGSIAFFLSKKKRFVSLSLWFFLQHLKETTHLDNENLSWEPHASIQTTTTTKFHSQTENSGMMIWRMMT